MPVMSSTLTETETHEADWLDAKIGAERTESATATTSTTVASELNANQHVQTMLPAESLASATWCKSRRGRRADIRSLSSARTADVTMEVAVADMAEKSPGKTMDSRE